MLLVLLARVPDVALGGQPTGKTPGAAPLKILPDYVPGEVIVLLSAEDNKNAALGAGERLKGVESALRGQVVRRSKISAAKEVVKVKLPPGKSVEMALAEDWNKTDSRIVSVEPNYRVHVQLTPNDTQYPQMWGLNNTGQTGGTPDADIDAPEAWNSTTGSSNVIVCVIDSGVDYMHPDLIDNMWRNPGEIPNNGIDDDANGYIDDVYGWDFAQNDSDPSDADGHGTHVAGTIAARGNNALGVVGVNWQCKIMACRFLDASGSGDTYDAIDCINYAVANGARILNNSWGGGGYSASLEAAIVSARNNGVLFVAAAGNSASNNDTTPHYPSNYAVDNIISVASTTHTDALSSFSCYGATTVHMGAPGSDILSTVPPIVTLFSEDFQGATVPGFAGTQMTLQGSANRWGTVTNAVITGNKAARGDLTSSPYQSGSDGSIVTPVLNTTGLRGLSVYFLIRLDSGTGDTLSVDVTNNGTTWTTLFAFTNVPGAFPPDFYFYLLADVPQNLQGPTTQFRWRWTTNSTDNTYTGVEIDDIAIQHIGSNYSNAYDSYSGTSMATPHVSGVAALVLASNPGLTYAQLKAKIINAGDSNPALAGRTISGRRLNASKCMNPMPPTASNVSASIPTNTPTLVTLTAQDDGQPTPPGALTYIVTALPAHGGLADPNGSDITAVPYSLLNHGSQVRYTPGSGYAGTDSFTFKANDGGTAPTGGDSNVATVSLNVITILYSAAMDSNPGWTLDTGWAWGTPAGGGSHGLDPTSGRTGSNVIGYNLNGDYGNNMAIARYARTPAFSCSGCSNIRLRFWRWLGVESANFDHATIEVSTNGTTWTTVWNHTGGSFSDTAWQFMEYALPAAVSNQPTVYLRWGMGPTDDTVTYPGWNIDDVEVVGDPGTCTPPPAPANPTPADGATQVASGTLSWGTVSTSLGTQADGKAEEFPAACPTTFDVYLGTTNPPTTLLSANLATPTCNAGVLNDGTTYYWKVIAKNSSGQTPGAIWSFTTISRVPFYTENLDSNPGWTVTGQWAFGTPTGQGGTSHGNPDPTSGATGTNVYGVNLGGDYGLTVGGPYYLTTSAIDCSAHAGVQLRFKRWLNTDWGSFASATVEVSANGSTWTSIYTNPAQDDVTDDAWQSVAYDISAVADGNATVYVRWGYQIMRAEAFAYSGWNVDDIVLSGESSCTPPAAPTNPNPANGAANVPVDTDLSWGGSSPNRGVIINEIDIGSPDWVELYNATSAAVNLTGWTLIAIDSRGYTTTLTLPTFTLNSGAHVVLHETAGTNTPTDLYFDSNIMWVTEAACSAALINAAGVGVDFARWSSSTGIPCTDTPPTGTSWTGPDPSAPVNYTTNSLGRDATGTDTDAGTDWENTCGASVSAKTPGGPNSSTPTAMIANDVQGHGSTGCDLSYDVYFGTTNPPTTLIGSNLATQACDPGLLAANTTYYWKVVAKDCCGQTSGPVWSFTTACDAPPAPTDPSPADGATSVDVNTDLAWSDGATTALQSQETTCPTTYDVYFGTTNPPTTLAGADLIVPAYDPGLLAANTTYYWRVVAKNCCGQTDGPAWSFRTACAAPPVPTNPGPADGAIDVPPLSVLSWNGMAPEVEANVSAAQPAAASPAADGPRVYTAPAADKKVAKPAEETSSPGVRSSGPDAGGYVVIDSDTQGGPNFNWIDISNTGTYMPLTDDSYCYPINLPFNFDFYGTGYSQLAVASNGTIYFQNARLNYSNTPIPASNSDGIDKYIAVYWDDLNPAAGGQVYYQVLGTAPHRVLVVQWQNVLHFDSATDSVTMQAQLHEGSGHILMLYTNPSGEAGSGATVGIQRDTSTGLQYVYNQAALHANLAVLFTRGVTYDLYLWSGNPAAKPATPTASCLLTPSYDPGTVQCTEINYWCVVAKNPCGQTQGPDWSFTTFRRPGDTNSDGYVDVVDLLSLVYSFGLCSGDPGFDVTCDFNDDGCVDTVDLLTLVYNWDQ
jgi:subtilisin family serine protease